MTWFRKSRCALLLAWFLLRLGAAASDNHENCEYWASIGECDKNPGWMWQECQTSCKTWQAEQEANDQALQGIHSFFDLSAPDIHGNVVNFEKFRKASVTVVVNVASECGRTDAHYKGLTQLWSRELAGLHDKIQILAFPCNQFGQQEPDDEEEILEWVQQTYGVEFTMMQKVDVNGPNAHLVYKYLKKQAGVSAIRWNFDTYFVVEANGTVHAYHELADPTVLKDRLLELAASIESDEL